MSKFLYIISLSIVISSYVSIFGGRRNTISIKLANPPQTEAYLNDSIIGTGIFKIKTPKNQLQENTILVFKSDVYKNDTLIVKKIINQSYAATDFISTFGLSILVDVATGNIYRLNTQKIIIDLKKENNK